MTILELQGIVHLYTTIHYRGFTVLWCVETSESLVVPLYGLGIWSVCVCVCVRVFVYL